MMAVIFPFEVPFYEKENVPVRYVGHPSVDTAHAKRSRDEDFKEYGLTMDQPVVGILPGSRTDEINRMLPIMLRAAERIQKEIPAVQFVLPQADSVSDELLQASFQHSKIQVKSIKNQFHDVVQCCDAVIIGSIRFISSVRLPGNIPTTGCSIVRPYSLKSSSLLRFACIDLC
jgi:lipid-A-disaccharide synthase